MLLYRGHAKDVPLLGKLFRRRNVFKLLIPKVHRSYQKISFWRKATPSRKNFKISLQKDPPAHRFTYCCQFLRKSVKQKWPNGCVVFTTKRVGILPLLWCFWSNLTKKFYRITLSPFPILCQVLSKSVQFSRRYIRKCLSESIQYRREVCRLLNDNNNKLILNVCLHRFNILGWASTQHVKISIQ